MRVFRVLAIFLGLAAFSAAFAIRSRADEWDKATKVTFAEPVQVPGTTLAAGTYVFRLLDSQSNRHIVQIYNDDHTRLITTVLAIANYRLEPAGKTIITFDERPADQPMALEAWFYPGDNFGQEFVYPKSEAEQLSRLNNREVPSTGSEEAYPNHSQQQSQQSQSTTAQNTPAPQNTPPPQSKPENPPSQPESAPAPSAAQQQPAPAPANPPAQANPAPAPAPNPAPTQTAPQTERQLPHTASFFPLVGLAGLAFLGLAVLLRISRLV
jgi:hypothetical protein